VLKISTLGATLATLVLLTTLNESLWHFGFHLHSLVVLCQPEGAYSGLELENKIYFTNLLFPISLTPSHHNLCITSNVYTYMLQHTLLQFCENVSWAALIGHLGWVSKWNWCFELVASHANRLIHILLLLIIHNFGNLKTATETLLHDVRISQHDLTFLDKGSMKTLNAKTDVIISTNSMSQHVFHFM
jgi:hypothetical protein